MRTKLRYTRRYTRRRRPRRDKRLPLLLALVGLIVYIALAMGAGAWAHNVLFGTNEPEVQSENEHSDSEAELSAQEITETVAFPAMEFHALSIPAEEGMTLQQTAAACKLRGGAGFVYDDRVLLSLYESRDTALGVAERLKAEQGKEALVASVAIDGVELRLTALPMRIDGVRDAFSAWQQTVQHMDALWQDADAGVASTGQVLSRMQDKRDALQEVCGKAFDDVLLSGRSDALEGLYGVMKAMIGQMDALLADPPQNILEVSAGIKYTVIRALMEYESYVEALTTDG